MKWPKSGGAWAIKWIYLNYVLTLNNKLSFSVQTPVVVKDFNAMQWIHCYQLAASWCSPSARAITYHIRLLANAPVPLHVCRRRRSSAESRRTSFLAILWAPLGREGCLWKIRCLLLSHQDRAASLMSNQPCTSRPLGKVHKARIDSTAYSLFPFETFIFNVTPTIMHSHLLSFVTNARSPHQADAAFIREMPPTGSLSAPLCFAAGAQPACSLVAMPLRYPIRAGSPRRHTDAGECAASSPAASWTSVTGDTAAWFIFLFLGGWGAILFHAGASERALRLGGRLGADAFILPRFSSGSPIGKSGPPSPFLWPFLIGNHPFLKKNRLSKCDTLLGLAPCPELLQVPSLQP